MNKDTISLSNEGVIQASTIRNAEWGTVAYRFVLRRNPHNSGEFVVHLQTERGYDSGFYTEDLEAAALDLKARAEIRGLIIDNDQRCIVFDMSDGGDVQSTSPFATKQLGDKLRKVLEG